MNNLNLSSKIEKVLVEMAVSDKLPLDISQLDMYSILEEVNPSIEITNTMREQIINLIAGHYLSARDDGNYYPQYLKLKKLVEEDKTNKALLVCNEVEVWGEVDHWTIDVFLGTIDEQVEEQETLIKNVLSQSPIGKIDFPKLREQKKSLVDVINHVDGGSELEGNLTGILHLIDSIQDFAVDVMDKNEEDVHLQDEE